MGLRGIVALAACAVLVAADTTSSNAASLLVDVGYGVYNGVYNSTTQLNVWKGIRFAASTAGANRWQAPKPPAVNRAAVQATTFGPKCPQSPPSVPTAKFNPGDEDCLFLNVYAPVVPHGKSLPVMIWIHPGGYGLQDGTQDMSEIINANNNGFVAVAIQYRLGAFGFLSSAEVKSKGVVNAGLLDQVFAFDWVKTHISKFGGDATKVTIAGESAGAGSVMLHAISSREAVWQNGIAASPYDPGQDNYNAPGPTQRYYDFAAKAGCGSSGEVFACLASKDSLTLQYASSNVSSSGTYATWAFLPVTDGTFLTGLPSVKLNQKQVNGRRVLVSHQLTQPYKNNANEGPLFVPATIVTLDDLIAWLHLEFPNLSNAQIQQILDAYPSPSTPADPQTIEVETNGYGPPYAINVSQVATGQQQRANNILAEATFVCPSYWLATAFTGSNKVAYHYQYSIPFAAHRADVTAYVGPATPNQGPQFTQAIRKIWGNFITQNNPSISIPGAKSCASNPTSRWPAWTDVNPQLINLNQTGGVPYQTVFGAVPITQYMDPGLKNSFTQANAYTWELNRGKRCDFWKAMGPNVPQ